MSRTIFYDVEEALSREVRRITFFNQRTLSHLVLQDTFDPITGDVVVTNVEPSFYDSSADAGFVQYPNFFVKLLKTREDRFTGRVEPPYGKNLLYPVKTAPFAYQIVLSAPDGDIAAPGDVITTSSFQIRKILPGYYIRTLTGNNIGTYIVSSITPSSSGPHTITVSNTLLQSLPVLYFTSATNTINFNTIVDLNTVLAGDNLVDASSNSFPIVSVNIQSNTIVISGGTPNLIAGATITRTGNVFQNTDTSPVSFIVMNPACPILSTVVPGAQDTEEFLGLSTQIPIDSYYLVRIDSKERQTHIDILNRVWEEFNPPRTGLPVIVRTAQTYEQFLSVDVATGGSNTISVRDNSGYNINDPITIINKFVPTQNGDYGFSGQFKTKVIGKISTNQLVLYDVVPDTFLVCDETKVISNAYMSILMFHFVDHNTKDIESAQYWVHEFTFWVQIWIDRLETPLVENVVLHVADTLEDFDGNVIINDI